MRKLIITSLTFFLSISLFQSCSGSRSLKAIVFPTTTTTVNPILGEAQLSYCLLEDDIATDVKTLFILDRSASNCDETGNCGAGVNGTDPDRTKRTNGLIKFLDDHTFKESEYFALGEFFCQNCTGSSGNSGTQDPEASPIIPGVGSSVLLSTPENDSTLFQKNLNDEFRAPVLNFRNTADQSGRGTNFRKALEFIRDTIKDDAGLARKKHLEEIENGSTDIIPSPAYYKVVFTSDGQPTDTGVNNYDNALIQFIKDDILELQNDSIVGPYIKRIYVSTGFYHFDANNVAEELLEKMAIAGNGKFFSFNNGEDIDFDKLLNVPIEKIHTTEEQLLIANLNTMWGWDPEEARKTNQLNWKVLRDTDGDGLHDFLEFEGCIDKADCDENGINDRVEFEKFDFPCKPSSDNPRRCSSTEFQIEASEDCLGEKGKQDSDGDGLTNCEERVLGTNVGVVGDGQTPYDTNFDQVPDKLALRFNIDGVAIGGGDNKSRPQSEIDTDEDGIFNLAEIKYFTPLRLDNSRISNLKPYDYTKEVTTSPDKPNVDCFELVVKDIPLASFEDEIEVHFVQKEKNSPSGKPYYRRFSKKMKDGKVKFTQEDFDKEE